MPDAFFWTVLPIAILEGIRIARFEHRRRRRSLPGALMHGGLDLVLLAMCAATLSPFVFIACGIARVLVVRARDGQIWIRGALKTALIGAAIIPLVASGQVASFADLANAAIGDAARISALVLVCGACVVAIVPARVGDEPRETLAAPLAFIAFARIALPLADHLQMFFVVVPVIAAVLSLVCALWLLSAGSRANHFEPDTLVSELILCERGVLLSFVWLGLASGEHLAGVGALLEWWSGGLALLALEAALRRRPLLKSMAFFAMAMAVCIPGTLGFVAEDLLAHGLLELRPWLAAAFVGVSAINAAALYLAIVHIIADLQEHDRAPPRPSLMMLVSAAASVAIGVMPRPFVNTATEAHAVVAGHAHTHMDLP